jgi:hypothetical protein
MSLRSRQTLSGFPLHFLSNGPQVLFAVTFAALYFGETIRENKFDVGHPDQGEDRSNPRF